MADPRDPDLIQTISQLQADLDELTKNVIARSGRVPHVAADPTSPPDGGLWIRSDDGTLRYRANGTTKTLTPAGWGRVASINVQANSGTTIAVADSGYTITWTAVAGRRYHIWLHSILQGSVNGDTITAFLTTSANVVIAECDVQIGTALIGMATIHYELTGLAAGATTYKIRIQRSIGTGNVTLIATATAQGTMCVEDIGAFP